MNALRLPSLAVLIVALTSCVPQPARRKIVQPPPAYEGPATITISNLPIYSKSCADTLRAALAKVQGLSGLSIDAEKRTAVCQLSDEDQVPLLAKALHDAGMRYYLEVDGKQSMSSGLPLLPKHLVDEMCLRNVHACSPECQQVIIQAANGTKATFEGSGPVKTITFRGKQFDEGAVLWNLGGAGFRTK